MNIYLRLYLLAVGFINSPLFAQEVQSLRTIALNKAVELLHGQLAKQQTQAQRTITLNEWQNRAGVLFGQAGVSLNFGKKTILEKFEEKYSRLNLVAQIDNDSDRILAFSDDAKQCFYKDYKTFFSVDIKTGTILQKFVGHDSSINSITTIPNSQNIISTAMNNSLKVWDTESGSCLRTLALYSPIWITSDTHHVLSGSKNGALNIWSIETSACVHNLEGHQSFIEKIAVTNDDTSLGYSHWPMHAHTYGT